MKTRVVFRGSIAALLFSCGIVALCSAIILPEHPLISIPPRDNAVLGANAHQSAASVPAPARRTNGFLSLADRVAYQRAIEDVYWRHRIWPMKRSDPKPALDAVISQAQLEKKVTEYLRNSQALEDDWERPITAEQLQSEMERMATHTKQPEVLRELFQAVGNDPFVVAECLARPILAERLATQLQAQDEKPTTVAGLNQPLRSWLAKAETQARVTWIAVSSANYKLPVIESPAGGCTDDTWTPTTLINAPTSRHFIARCGRAAR